MIELGVWALKNWRWAVPTLLCVVLGAYCGVLMIKVANRDAAIAGHELEKQKEVAEALRKQQELHEIDLRNTEALLTALRINKASIEKELVDAQAQIDATPISHACVDTDAARAFRNSLRRPPNAGQTRPISPGPASGRTDQR